MRRYARTPVISFGKQYGTSTTIQAIRKNIDENNIRYDKIVLQDGQRLDSIAGEYYGDAKLWWIIAAASNIGWMFQVPPGTLLTVPNLEDVSQYVG